MHRLVFGAARAVLVTALLVVPATTAGAQAVNAKRGLAVDGYDPVAYFTDQRPVKGDAAITATVDAVTYRFASAANRDAFMKAPSRYQPQYGGFCAYGVSRGYKVTVDPTAFAIVDGKLYLNYSHSVQKTWNEDRAGYIAKADQAWPRLRQ